MKISNFLSPDDIFIRFGANSKKQLFEEMVRLAAGRREGLDQRSILDQLIERERLGCTGIGNGIAIPHARCRPPSAMTELVAQLAILSRPIDFDASDGMPVDIVFMLLAPEHSGGEHLALLALASRLLASGSTVKALRRSSSSKEAWAAIAGAGDPSKTAA